MKKPRARKGHQANGMPSMRRRQRLHQQFNAARFNKNSRDDGALVREACSRAAVVAQRGLSAKVTEAAYRAWCALRSPAAYAAALFYVAAKLKRIAGRITASIVNGLVRRWARVDGFMIA